MTSDTSKEMNLVDRLRQNATSVDCLNDPYPEILLEAADEIERLRAVETEWMVLSQDDGKKDREIERLQRLADDLARLRADDATAWASDLAVRDRLSAALERIIDCYSAERRQALTWAPLGIARKALGNDGITSFAAEPGREP